ncbi:Cys/Met metabolism PLP-dependent enzyme-domain-containing protein [Fennellomyces sp. T-0311]|nr:Cys/Met metabolism PLP-dependent enzyme-domain-containing protein [Fennellomyces sp. T-0311]
MYPRACSLKYGFGTRAIHAGQQPDPNTGAVVPPISLSTTFKHSTADAMDQVHKTEYVYSRDGNPNRSAFEAAIASLEGAKFAAAFASGIAVTSAVLTILDSGSHLIASDALYGGTYQAFTKVAKKHGLETTVADLRDARDIVALFKPNTKMVWIESPSNPTLRIVDIQAIAQYAHQHGAFLVVDNTFMTPYFQNPLQLGADIAMHSVTKYINGHSDVLMGVAATNSKELYEELHSVQACVGGVPSPVDCFLARRGLVTLELRMIRHEQNAMAVAEFLEKHPRVEQVFYPGLKSHPQHELAAKQQRGFGAMLSFRLQGDIQNVNAFYKNLRVATLAASLGGAETLIGSPAYGSHMNVPIALQKSLDITEMLVRVSIGVENTEDLVEDFKIALERAY